MDFEIRQGRSKPQGPKKLHKERAVYLDLVGQGMSSTEACRIVGITQRTGKRWRNGHQPSGKHRGAPPITKVAPPSGPSRYLTEDERIQIADLVREKASLRAISRRLGRSPSTISREIRRNRHPAMAATGHTPCRLVLLPAGHSARDTRTALIQTVQELPQHMRKSLTWDQGSEMAADQAFTRATGMPVYSCNPGSPWQRGSNENTNGLLRQRFPKSTDLAVHDRQRLDTVAAELNNRPRKALGWDTPTERFATLLTTTY